MNRYYEYIRWANQADHHPSPDYSFDIPDTIDKDTSFEIRYANRNTWAIPFVNPNSNTGFWGGVNSSGILTTNYFSEATQSSVPATATIKYDRNKYYVDGNLVYTSAEISTTATGIRINSSRYGDNANSLDIYYIKVWQNDVLTRDLIPCLNDSNEKGFYDRVSETFFKDLKGTATLYNQLNNVTASGTGGTVTGTGAYTSGTSVTLTAVPSSGYKFNRWKLNGYTRLEYIQSTGTQYINCGFTTSANMYVEADCEPSANGHADQSLFSFHNNSNSGQRCEVYRSSDSKMYYFIPNSQKSVATATPTNTRIKVKYQQTATSQTLTVGDESVTGNLSIGTNPYVEIFTYVGTYRYYGEFKLYSIKFKKDDVLVRDYIPVKRNSDNAIGLLDLVEMKFYGNSGSGTFTAGSELSDEIIFTTNPLTFTVYNDLDFIANFDRTSNCQIKVNGTWKYGMMYFKVNGTWKMGSLKLKQSGNWKNTA